MIKLNGLRPFKGRISEELLKKFPHLKDKLEELEENYTTYHIQLYNPTSNPIKSIQLSQVHSDDTASIDLLAPEQNSGELLFRVKNDPFESYSEHYYVPYMHLHAALNIDYELDGEHKKTYFVPPSAKGARKVKIDVMFGDVGIVSKPIRRIQTHKISFTNKSSFRILEIELGHVGSSESAFLESLEPGATSETMKFTIGYPLPNEIIQISWSMLPLRYMKDGDERTFIGSGVLSNNSSTIQVVFDNEGCRFDYS